MQTGLDRLPSQHRLVDDLKKTRVGLLAHPASVNRSLEHASDVLDRLGIRFTLIFGPEHGYGGEAQDMIGVGDAHDRRGIPIRSLYGETFNDLIPKKSDLAQIDRLVVDMQDVGSRYYTFIWTAVLAMRACAEAGVRMVVLDRPNPLGAQIEGRSLDPAFRSFVGLEPLPIRHALTLGEVCAWRRAEESLPPDVLSVVGFEGAPTDSLACEWDARPVFPSPNMPTFDTMLVYPGGCLLEGTNLSDGRGTTRPFEITGAPFVDGFQLAHDLNRSKLPGFTARPLTFRPMFHKHAGKECGGVQIHVTNPRAFRPVATYAALIALAHHQSPDAFRFRTEKYEFVDTIPAFDLLTGSAKSREAIVRGDAAVEIAEELSQISAHDREIVARAKHALTTLR